ncbi:MAG: helix-turn-helix domain-containing protein [Monoglobaceae bacterium]
MKVSYDKLWKILIDKKMKKYQLREKAHISSNSVAKLSKDELVSMEVLMKICETLECDIGDICEFYNDSEEITDA